MGHLRPPLLGKSATGVCRKPAIRFTARLSSETDVNGCHVRREGGSTRIHRMKWHPASSARQFRLLDQTLMPDQVAESWRTRRVKEEAGGFASISAAFGRTG